MKFYTYTGKMIDITNPSEDAICSMDIAHALSLICRAAGHFKHFYSVAQHSLNCMREACARGDSERVCLAALLHDAAEAYLCDVPTPVKRELDEYKKIEKKFEDAIWKKYGLYPLTQEEQCEIKKIDEAVLYYEFKMIHTIPIKFEKTPEMKSVPDVAQRDMKEIENMMLCEMKAFEKNITVA